MLSRVRGAAEAMRSSLFFVPLLFVLAAFALAQGVLLIDAQVFDDPAEVPALLKVTVDSSRSILETVAGATITFAAVAFSISLLVVQLTSSQFSPRVLYDLFRDPFIKRVMGLVIGVFTFCLLVLRAVRSEVEEAGDPVIPHLAVATGVVLGVIAILAIVALISHAAHMAEAAEIVKRIGGQTRDEVERLFPVAGEGTSPGRDDGLPGPPDGARTAAVSSTADGWVQHVDAPRLLELCPAGGIVRLEVGPGAFVVHGETLATIWPATEEGEALGEDVRGAITLGMRRAMRQDVAFGIRRLEDIALRALSPSLNDPTTAVEVLARLRAILRDVLLRDTPAKVLTEEDRTLVRPGGPGHGDYLELAVAQIRRAGAGQPTVVLALLEMLGRLRSAVLEAGLSDRVAALDREIELTLNAFEATDPPLQDLRSVRVMADRMVGPATPG